MTREVSHPGGGARTVVGTVWDVELHAVNATPATATPSSNLAWRRLKRSRDLFTS
jgi:hypothetical protein